MTVALLSLLGVASSCNKMNMDAYRDVNFDAVYVVNGESSTISVIDVNSDAVRKTFALGKEKSKDHADMDGAIAWPHHFALSGARDYLVIGAPGMDLSAGHAGGMEGMPGKVAVLNATSGMIDKVVELPVPNHNAIYSPDGSEIWTSQMQDKGQVLVYDAAALTLKNTIAVGRQPAEITFSADGKTAFVANGMDDNVMAIDPVTKAIKATLPVGHDPVGAWPGADNKMYVDNEEGKSISVIDAATLRVEETIDLGFTPAYATYLPGDAPELWVTDPDNGKVHYFSRMNGAWMNHGSTTTGPGAHAVAFTRDYQKAYVTNQLAGTVSVLDVQAKKKLKDVLVGQKPNGVLIRYQ
jgi:YVTN family beta-propeller protein